MKKETNKFGSGNLHEPEDVKGKIFTICCACSSIYSEHLSWVRANSERNVLLPAEAENVVVLSCQVTDVAILNDLRQLEQCMRKYPHLNYYVGGCLARRFDIELPEGVERITSWREDYQEVLMGNIYWVAPFWAKDFDHVESYEESELKDGNLFRYQYPLRISVGCQRNCAYCSIKHTRGEGYELDPSKQIDEFLAHKDVLLIADSPSETLIKHWCKIAIEHNKPISIRNLEPVVAIYLIPMFDQLADLGLLRILHIPIQSDKPETLKRMNRGVKPVENLLACLPSLKAKGVILATNVIVDYEDLPNPDMEVIGELFDYVSWNPYWDGKWDRELAEQRWEKYFA